MCINLIFQLPFPPIIHRNNLHTDIFLLRPLICLSFGSLHINAVTAVYIRLEILPVAGRLAAVMGGAGRRGGGEGRRVAVRARFADEIQYRAINGC